ncbi:MAG: SDR family NAD(P)-dependent oxidoreductase, partial [Rhizobiaceae bacterium]|nr:SDR family NAD(P)-dependent oxidoreductase [Hyphomicrobiales bacterium]NRB30797.1 SDR family NAD(P)-dependent oxidoreductase [Rhizobiaceae bacterium]
MAPVYLITGGSRGIGAAVARLAAEQGAAVCVNYVANGDAAQAVVANEPYRLAEDIRGIGFRTADALARNQG